MTPQKQLVLPHLKIPGCTKKTPSSCTPLVKPDKYVVQKEQESKQNKNTFEAKMKATWVLKGDRLQKIVCNKQAEIETTKEHKNRVEIKRRQLAF